MSETEASLARLNTEKAESAKTLFGFWVYIMADCVLFAALFAVFVILRESTNGGEAGSDIFSLPFVFMETLILLTSSFTCGLARLAMDAKQKANVIRWLAVTGLLGLAFLTLEIFEFHQLVQEGNGWRASAFLSSYFTLVGIHGMHITIGLLWLVVVLYLVQKKGLTAKLTKSLKMFGLFWHFLDLVWIFIFTVVYLLGVSK